MTPRFDVAVVGLGAHGSAIAAHGARAGLAVCGIDRATPPHAHGAHHGESRIIRKAYYEDERYVPLMRRAYALWDALAADTGTTLMKVTGGLLAGPVAGEVFPRTWDSARRHGLAHEALDHAATRERFPMFRLAPGMKALYEPDAGVLFPEACVRAHLAVARAAGAELRLDRAVRTMDRDAGGVTLTIEDERTGAREQVRAARAIVALGAGLASFRAGTEAAITVERQVVAHFAPRPDAGLDAMPVFAIEEDDGRFHYGFPDLGSGVKVARHHGGATNATDVIDEAVHDDDIEAIRAFVTERLPDADGPLRSAATCRYANTADGHFLVDRTDPRVLVISACSGHGFKFAPVIGEVAIDLVRGRVTAFDLSLFEVGTPAYRSRAALAVLAAR